MWEAIADEGAGRTEAPSRREFLLGAAASLLPAGARALATAPPARRPTLEMLGRDVALLQSAYERMHPGLLRYNTPEQIRAHCSRLQEELVALPSTGAWLGGAYLAFARFAAKVRCGHTYANFHNQSDLVKKALFEQADKVPAEFRWIGTTILVTRDLSREQALPAGTVITAVNGMATAGLLAKLLEVARADGSNDAKRIAQMEVQALERYEAFDVYLPLIAPGANGRVSLECRRPGRSATERIDVQAATYDERLAARRVDAGDERAGWRFDTGDARCAVLKMPDWALYDSKWDWKAFIARCFQRLAADKPAALVLDLRGNEGGLDVGDEILPHLVEHELWVDQPRRLVRYRDAPEDLRPFLDTWDPSFLHWGADAQPLDERFYELRQEGRGTTQRRIAPRGPRFAGKVFVLIGPDNSSATFQFAQTIRAARLGTLVGRSTGGNLRGINGGAFFFLRLPGCGLELDLPLIGQFPREAAPDAGIEPDIPVSVDVGQVLAGMDGDMAAVRAHLDAMDTAPRTIHPPDRDSRPVES